ncbi:MAG: hypothetical protein JWM46_278 [Candidatus Kaiserbacteria bacterium]|nr:hypothetical protein [Candidatus Kaiserbacteria bacterium]
MADELFLEGKNYMSSKQAAVSTGYAQDYIGQLARGGLIDAQRVGGLWYVSLDSLNAYQKNAEQYKPMVPAPKQASDIDSIVSFDGKDYISASRAAKLTSYNQDYIGQLARGGKILSRQIGNRWYIEREGLLAHKSQKDSMLAAVQSEAVGLMLPKPAESPMPSSPLFNYTADTRELMPKMDRKPDPVQDELREQYNIPIRVVRTAPRLTTMTPQRPVAYVAPKAKTSDITISRAIGAGVALTFVIVLSYGFVTLKKQSTYTFNFTKSMNSVTKNALTASAGAAVGRMGDVLENMVAPEMTYVRK